MRIKALITVLVYSLLSIGGMACSSRPVIVSDPPWHAHVAPEAIPWEEEYARSRPKPEVFEDTSDPHSGQKFQGELETESVSKESGTLNIVADIIAFPFRGIGWIISQIF